MENRYSRQELFAPIGKAGQERLCSSLAVVAGCGALGSRAAELLARAGVGRLRVIDRDVVEWSNLQRQALFEESDARGVIPKAAAAEAHLRAVNSEIKVEGVVADLTPWNAEELLRGADVVLDGLDNFETRYLLNDACVKLSLPWIYGGAVSSYGTTMNVVPGKTPCLRCVFEEMPPAGGDTCDTAGVLGSAVAWVSAVQSNEALKILTGNTSALRKTLLTFDLWENRLAEVNLPAAPKENCPACGRADFSYLEGASAPHVSLCGRNAVQVRPSASSSLDLDALAARLAPLGEVRKNKFLVQFSVNGYEMTVFADARAMVSGTDDPATARGLYAKYVGA